MASLRRRLVVAAAATRPGVLARALRVPELTLWVSQKPQRKYRGCEGGRGPGLVRLRLPGEVNPRVGLLVEAEDLHGG